MLMQGLPKTFPQRPQGENRRPQATASARKVKTVACKQPQATASDRKLQPATASYCQCPQATASDRKLQPASTSYNSQRP